MRNVLLSTVFLGLTFTTAPALAEPTDPGAVQSAIQAWLGSSESRMGEISITANDVTTSPNGDAVDVVLKNVGLKHEDTSMPIGDISFTTEKNGNGDYDVTDIAVPEKIVFKDPDSSETLTLTWTLSKGEATWSPLVEGFRDMDMEMSTVELTPSEAPSEGATMAAMRFVADTTEATRTSWTQNGHFEIDKLAIKADGGEFLLDKLSTKAAVDKLDVETYTKQRDLFDEMHLAAGANDTAQVQKLKSELLAMSPVMQGVTYDLDLTGMSFEEGSDAFSLNDLSFAFGYDQGSGENDSSITLNIAGQGIEMPKSETEEDKAIAKFLPTSWNIPIALVKLPKKEAHDLFIEMVLTGIEVQQEPQVNPGALLPAMGQAGSQLLVKGLNLQNRQADIDGNAEVTVDLQAAMTAVGTAKLTLAGLAKLEEEAKTLPQHMQQDIGGALIFLKGLGKPETDGNGDIVYTYDFNLPKDGNLTLNGQPMAGLFGN